jgi:Domain of unknown function (DUF4062)/Tetratricopeptide repeat
MADKPVIFISSTSDLRSARDLVGHVLYSMGYEPVWQEIAGTDGGELLEVLRQRLAPASLVVQLVGTRYGAEPPRPTAEFGRVSYTQFEALEAERLGKKVIYHFLDDNFPAETAAPEPAELVSLQAAYRQRLIDANRLRYDRIANPGDLELSIRRISDELAALRKQADRRQRNLLRVGLAGLAVAIAIGAFAFVKFHRQEEHAEREEKHAAKVETKLDETTLKLDQQAREMAALRAAVAAAITPKPPAAGQTQPPPIPPEILEKAKVLVERGNAEDQALGKIALKQHAEADRIIQELKQKPGNPIDEAFRLFTMEGDNWYQANEPDKAIEPYEKAVMLKSRDLPARKNLLVALVFARLGSVAENQKRAIKLGNETLKLVQPGTSQWASIQNSLGNAWYILPTGNREENLKKAIAAYEAALTVYTKQAYPNDWASTQINLGVAWQRLPTGNKTENLKKAIAIYEGAFSVYTKQTYPISWATVQNNLGSAWDELPTGNRGDNLKHAIAAYEAALTVRATQGQRSEWAETQNNLGNAFMDLPTGDTAENLKQSIAAYEAAFTVFTKEAFPNEWATTQHNLGNAWREFPTGNKADNLKKSIAAYEGVLTVWTKETNPVGWAWTQNSLGAAWKLIPTGNKADDLKKAIAAYEAALTVRSKQAFPLEWATTENNLGSAWQDLPTGDKGENLRQAIAAFDLALTVRTKEAYPAQWATTEGNLGLAWHNSPTGDKSENLKKAIAAYEAALTVQTKESDPSGWAWTEHNLGLAWKNLPAGNKAENLKRAIAAYEAGLDALSGQKEQDLRFSLEVNLSWSQLLAGDFAGAVATFDRAPPEDKADLSFQLNYAHALLFAGRTDEARALYRKNREQKIPDQGKNWEQVALEDLDELEKLGHHNRELAGIRDLLKPAKAGADKARAAR